jgi:hypothetical protein
MNMEFLNTMGTWWVAHMDVPSVTLLVIGLVGFYILWKVQRDPTNSFDFADMMRDDAGKPSAARLASFVCLAISTWGLMFMMMNKGIDDTLYLGYIALWSGTKVAEKAIDAWSGRGSPAAAMSEPAPKDPAQ